MLSHLTVQFYQVDSARVALMKVGNGLSDCDCERKDDYENEQDSKQRDDAPAPICFLQSLNFLLSHHWQDRRSFVQLLILPENRRDAKRFLLLNQAGQVMAKERAKHFVDHRRVGLADNRIANFRLTAEKVDSTVLLLW
jgi:hypothetical protein